MKDKIIVVGSSNVDLIMKMERLPEKGETMTDAEFMQTYGGKGANQAVGAARAGGNVVFINCVGDDAYTPQMLENYKKDGIDISHVYREEDIASGHALVMIGGEGNNYLSVAPGANYRLKRDKIDQAISVFDDAAMIVMQYEILADTIQHVLNIAGEKGIPVMWNFAPARAFDLTYLDKVAILVVNEVEAAFLSDQKVDSKEEVKVAAQKLKDKGVGTVIITLGKQGAYYLTDGGKNFVPAFEVEAVDTTAAGDVFCGSLAAAMVEGKSLEEAIRFASAASALAVTKMGAQPSAPSRREIMDFLKNRSGS
jgi:ribokinase